MMSRPRNPRIWDIVDKLGVSRRTARRMLAREAARQDQTAEEKGMEPNGYTCGMCKKYFLGKPVRRGGMSSFCQTCADEMVARSVAARRSTYEKALAADLCTWCGKPLGDEPRGPSKDPNSSPCLMHLRCDRRRNWVLECVRYGPKMAKYVASIEEREAPRREEAALRKAEEAKAEEAKAAERAVDPAPMQAPGTSDGARLAMLEKQIANLIAALGGTSDGKGEG